MVELKQHNERLKQFDEKLAELERATRQTEEERREYINRNSLNKPVCDGYTRG